MNSVATFIRKWWTLAFNLPVLQKSRLQWIDYLRAIAIILVVYRHVLIGIERSGKEIQSYLVNANMIFYSFRMPLFFILSGIFISRSLSKRTVREVILNKFETLLYPYFIWTFLQISLQIILSKYTNSDRTLIDYTYILYQPRNIDQFWYLPALFNTSVIYLLIKTKLRAPVWMQFVLGLLFYFTSVYFQKVSMISDWMEFYIFFAIGDSISQLFFKDYIQQLFKRISTLLIILPFFAFSQYYYLTHQNYYLAHDVGEPTFLLIALIGCLCMISLSFQLQQIKFFPFFRAIGYHSLYIYVMHVFVAALIRMVLTKFFGIENNIVLLLIGIAFSVTIPVIIYNLLIRDKPLWFLFSFRKNSSKPLTVTKGPAPLKSA